MEDTVNELLRELQDLNAQYNSLLESQASLASINRQLHPVAFNSGDTGFMMSCSALVMLMTLPGISLFYSGAVSIKHIMTTFIQTMSVSAVITALWMLCGYSLAFSPATPSQEVGTRLYGDFSRGWLAGLELDSVHQLALTIPETTFCMFQLTNAIIACALIIGGFACRTKFLSVLVFISLWLLLVYCPLSHMHRHPKGWLFTMEVLDFAGGNVVHISAGVTALMSSYYVGPRSNIQEQERFESRNILLSVWGACFVLVGWFGFNMGSSYSSDASSSNILIVTMLGASASAVSWISVEWYRTGTPSILGILCGAIAGLVSISAGVGYLDSTGAVVTGVSAGFCCYMAVEKEKKVRTVDDPLNTFSLNFIGGLVGGFLVGFFAKEGVSDVSSHSVGAFYGNPRQIYIQLLGIAVTTLWSALASLTILVLVDKSLGLRVPVVHEQIGLDISQLHETIIDMPSKKLKQSISKAVAASLSTSADELDGGNEDDLDNNNHGDDYYDDGDEDGATNTGTGTGFDSVNAPPIYTQKSIISGLTSL